MWLSIAIARQHVNGGLEICLEGSKYLELCLVSFLIMTIFQTCSTNPTFIPS